MPLGNRRSLSLFLIATCVALAGSAFGQAQDEQAKKAGAAFFQDKVFPILKAHCFKCHVQEKKGGLQMLSREALLKGGETGPALVPGKPEDSLLISSINYGDYEMPPSGKLPQDKIDILTKWVELAAPWSPNVKIEGMLGDLTGHTFFVMPEDGAKVLADLLLRRLPSSGTQLDELERSSLLEAGNILAGSFLNALADCINGLLLPSVPTLDICEPQAFFDGLGLDPQHDMVILAETEFYVEDDDSDCANPEGDSSSPGPAPKLRGASLFLPDSHSLEHLFASILAVRPGSGR